MKTNNYVNNAKGWQRPDPQPQHHDYTWLVVLIMFGMIVIGILYFVH